MKYYLSFDDSRAYGSVEHYFHYLLGYLLPALNVIIFLEKDRPSTESHNVYFVRSCGPVMDKITEEISSYYGSIIKISAKKDSVTFDRLIKIPRWDIEVSNKHVGRRRLIGTCRHFLQWSPLKLSLLAGGVFRSMFKDCWPRLRDDIFSKAALLPTVKGLKVYQNKLLVLQRSPQPKYYDENGKAEFKGYGAGRRQLVGVEEAVSSLRNKNLPIEIFEPGKHSLIEQIEVFRNCSGVIGIRGAEFANQVWMAPGSLVICYNPANMPKHNPMESLSTKLNLDCHIIQKAGTSPVKLNPLEISDIVALKPRGHCANQ